MVSMLTSSEVDEGFISGVMVSMLTSSEVDQGFISGVMVSMLTSSEVDEGFMPVGSNQRLSNWYLLLLH